MWQKTEIESYLQQRLKETFKEDADNYWAKYIDAKDYLCNNIYKEIKGAEKDLTDHSADHVIDVLKKIGFLLFHDGKIDNYNVIEIYTLCLCALFHDVGNILGRVNHNRSAGEIYNEVRKSDSAYRQERFIILNIVRAHCGKTASGSKDTLLEVKELDSLYDNEVHCRELAAILRFADELAEGIQRTSQFANKKGLIDSESVVYHKYAEITTIFIDRGGSRIAVTYNIEYPIKGLDFKVLMQHVYTRILKLDCERRYCKYYASSLDCFKHTDVSFNFTIDGDLCDMDIPNIVLNDKYCLVEEEIDNLIRKYPALDVANLLSKLTK